jgi:hypothetical protein
MLPNPHCAFVEEKKIRRYLLNPDHPGGKTKAGFFLGRGASVALWPVFRDVLVEHGRTNPVTGVRQHPDQPVSLHQVDCHVRMPDGSVPCIRTVWEIRDGQPCPRLVTAHPLKA